MLKTVYNEMPVQIQNLLLSAYGLWLKRLRFGRDHDSRVSQLRQAEARSIRDWQQDQLSRLQDTLTLALQTVPYYRERPEYRNVASLEDIQRLPILTKEETQRAGRLLVSDRYHWPRLHKIHTGGTTGRPLTVYCSAESLRRNYAFFYRIREWAGITKRSRVATFAGRTIVSPTCIRPPYWRHNWASDTLLLSSYHLAPTSVDDYISALAEFSPDLIDSYPSSIEPVARRIVESRDVRIRPRAIITSSETLFSETRTVIQEAFDCRIFDHYGSAEMVACISQCESGQYHVHPEYGLVELVIDGRPARPGECGEIVATGLINPVMPLIRYATGDMAVRGEVACRCGRTFPIIERIEGRTDDCVITPEGRRIGRLDPIFKAVVGIYESQIVQDAPNHLRVELVPRPGLQERELTTLLSELRSRVGTSMDIDIVRVPQIRRSASGKLKTVVNEMSRRLPL